MKIVRQLWIVVGQPVTLVAAAALAVTAGALAITLDPPGRVRPLTADEVAALALARPAASPSPRTPGPEPTQASLVRARVLGSAGGFVIASCTAEDLAVLRNWSPAPGYRASVVTREPAKTSRITFSGGSGYATVKLAITCADGEPRMASKVGHGKLAPPSGVLLGDGAWTPGLR